MEQFYLKASASMIIFHNWTFSHINFPNVFIIEDLLHSPQAIRATIFSMVVVAVIRMF